MSIKISDIFDREKYNTDKGDLGYIDNFYDDFFVNFKSKPINFLEIGVYNGGSIKLWKDYFHPNSKIYAADINPFLHLEGTYSVTGDMYSDEQVSKFSNEYFDLIVDDGPHTLESFTLVMQKYYSKLKSGGTLIIEDVIDPSWVKPLIELSSSLGYSNCEVIDMTGKQKTNELLECWKNGLYVLKLTKGIQKMNNKNITVFYHFFVPDTNINWIWWIDEQMGLLKSTGLADASTVNMCITIPLGLVNQKNNSSYDELVINYIKQNYPFVNILDVRSVGEQPNLFEGQTLIELYEHSQKTDGYVLYFHNKGMSSYGTHVPGGLHDWKEYMHYFNIEKWEDCVAKLDEGYDCCGVNWLKEENLNNKAFTEEQRFLCNHFAGNFWWANTKYIRTLPNPLEIEKYSNVEYMMRELFTYRYAFEAWIGTDDTNYYSFHQSDTHHYFKLYDRSNYDPNTEKIVLTPDNIMQEIAANNIFNWREHKRFAEWIVRKKSPEVIVDLGVDFAYSTFSFALPKIGHVYGVDSFVGDNHAGQRDTYDYVTEKKKELNLDNITFIKGYFDDVAKTWDKKIDILHIDGLHTYEAVKNDYETWIKFVNDGGVILFHDTYIDMPTFGVRRFFNEIDLPKTNFTISNGLGVVSKDAGLIEEINQTFGEFIETKYIQKNQYSNL